MADTVPAAFDPDPKTLGNTYTFTAGAAILSGQAVAFNATGVDWTVQPSDTDATDTAIGIALTNAAAAGDEVSVMCFGPIVKACEGKGAAIDAGTPVQISDVPGCIQTAVTTAAGTACGVALQDISANSTGYIMLGWCMFGKGA